MDTHAVTKTATPTPKPMGMGRKLLNGLFYLPAKATGVDVKNYEAFKRHDLSEVARHTRRAADTRAEAAELAEKLRKGKMDPDLWSARDVDSLHESARHNDSWAETYRANAASRDPHIKREKRIMWGSRGVLGGGAIGAVLAANRPTEKTAGAIDALRKGLSRYGALMSGKAAKAAKEEVGRFRAIRDAIHRANPALPPNSLEAKYRKRLKRPKPDPKETMRGMADSMLKDRQNAARSEGRKTLGARAGTIGVAAGLAEGLRRAIQKRREGKNGRD